MRRSFMSDQLYWVVFTEYIQNQLQSGNQPLEFFLEGTRSRTGKFLQPKLGEWNHSVLPQLHLGLKTLSLLKCQPMSPSTVLLRPTLT